MGIKKCLQRLSHVFMFDYFQNTALFFSLCCVVIIIVLVMFANACL